MDLQSGFHLLLGTIDTCYLNKFYAGHHHFLQDSLINMNFHLSLCLHSFDLSPLVRQSSDANGPRFSNLGWAGLFGQIGGLGWAGPWAGPELVDGPVWWAGQF